MTTPIDPEAQEQARLEARAFEMHMRPEDYAAYERDMAEHRVEDLKKFGQPDSYDNYAEFMREQEYQERLAEMKDGRE